jgi:hypothetical protein
MTPEAAKLTPLQPRPSAARATATGLRARSLSTCAATVRVGNSGQTFRFDVAPADRAGGVATLRETPQRRLDLLQLGARGVRDRPEHVVILALSHLLCEIRRQGISLVPQVRTRIARPLAKLIPTPQQPFAYRLDFQVNLPALRRLRSLRT